MKNSRLLPIIAFAVLIAAIGLWLAGPGIRGGLFLQKNGVPANTPPSSSTEAPASKPASLMLLTRLYDKLRSEGITPADLAAFRRAVLSLPPDAAIEAIIAFLATGKDALTTEQFEIGERGELTGAPTLRILLLDLLGRLCRENRRTEAASIARTLLDAKTSADEWAIALRNIAWITPGERTYLAEKTREMLTHQPWRQQPSAGFREAFDLIVFTRSVTFIPDLAEMIRGEDTSLQRSAGVALDRMAERSPLEVMTFLNTNSGELADRPFLRADYFSKADLSQPAQRIAVEAYLSRPDVGQPEKEKLIAALASPGTFAADTLVTEPPPAELPASYFNGLRQSVDDWISTSRFPSLTPSLLKLRAQLAE